jgi:hypothetical protein
MIVAGSASPLLLSSAGGYNLTNSLRFRSSASAYLSRTPASAGNQKTWTHSVWVKRGKLGTSQRLLALNGGNDATYMEYGFSVADDLAFGSYTTNFRITSQVFRDPSAWYHIVLAFDTTQATAANRVKLYVNGVEVTAFGTNNAPVQNQDYAMNLNALTYIGTSNGSVSLVDGYLAETNFIDGQALTPSSFGETSATTGVWIPKKYTGTYGTNGFYLKFTDNSALTTSSNVGLGKDFSGNGNYWVTNNISITAGSTYDSMTDVPTLTSATAANYCVLNPLLSNSNITFSAANLSASVGASGGIYRTAGGTIAVTSGKWYFEDVYGGGGNNNTGVGAITESKATWESDTTVNSNFWFITGFNGNKINGDSGGTSYGSGFSTNDIVMCAVDMDNGKIWWGKNGTWFASGDPATGTNAAFTNLTSKNITPAFFGGSGGSGGATHTVNFGQRPFAYTPPTGFVALNTFNLPTPTIGATASTTANKYMDATLYTGTGATQSVVNAGGFQPDLVWMKRRNGAGDNNLFDSVRGATKDLYSNSTLAEATYADSLTSFNSNGWSLGTDASGNYVNTNGQTMVGWQWRANGTPAVTNTAGSITSTVSANTSAGFSVVTFTGNGNTAATVGHGLGVAPRLIILKDRQSTASWLVYHASVTDTTFKYLVLNSTAAVTTNASTVWGAALPTSSVFGVNCTQIGGSTNNFVAYCFSEVAGYSAFGSYTGNGSTDGPFIYTGFKPAFILTKDITTGSFWWEMVDSARSPYNVVDKTLYANVADAEYSGSSYNKDLLSNGFKIRNTNGGDNTSGSTYIYMAFAENPFKYANAR